LRSFKVARRRAAPYRILHLHLKENVITEFLNGEVSHYSLATDRDKSQKELTSGEDDTWSPPRLVSSFSFVFIVSSPTAPVKYGQQLFSYLRVFLSVAHPPAVRYRSEERGDEDESRGRERGGEVIKCDECYKVTLRGEGKKNDTSLRLMLQLAGTKNNRENFSFTHIVTFFCDCLIQKLLFLSV